MATHYTDRDLSTPWQVGPDLYAYPFAALGDTTTRTITRRYWVKVASWSPTAQGVSGTKITVASVDYYLVRESEPQRTNTGLYSFERVYAAIPTPQVDYSSAVLTKPTLASVSEETTDASVQTLTAGKTLSTTAYTDAAVNYLNHWQVNALAIYGPMIATDSTVVSFAVTGGTFTLTYKSSTTAALAYNATIGTINTALNGLADVISDGLTFSGGVTNIASSATLSPALSVGTFGTDLLSIDPSSLTRTNISASHAFSYKASSTQNSIILMGLYPFASHGLTHGGALAFDFTAATTLTIYDEAQWAVEDANTIAIALTSSQAGITVGPYLRDYTAGVDRVRTKSTTTFYLPGVSAGITTPDDIPIVDPATNDTVLLALMLANTSGYSTYDAEPLGRWLDGPIYEQTVTAIDMANL